MGEHSAFVASSGREEDHRCSAPIPRPPLVHRAVLQLPNHRLLQAPEARLDHPTIEPLCVSGVRLPQNG